jgi:DNA-binding MarR family transcriptional regulator
MAINLQALRMVQKMIGGEHTINQLVVIIYIIYAHLLGEKCSQSSIAQSEDMSKTTVFNAIMRWKELGNVSFVDDPDDSRIQYVIPTQKTMGQRKQIWRSLMRMDDASSSGL